MKEIMNLFRPETTGPDSAKPVARRLRYVGRIRADRYEAAAHDPNVRALIARATWKLRSRATDDS